MARSISALAALATSTMPGISTMGTMASDSRNMADTASHGSADMASRGVAASVGTAVGATADVDDDNGVSSIGDPFKIGGMSANRVNFVSVFLTRVRRVAWILRLMKPGAEDEGQPSDIMKIIEPDDLGDIGNLGLSPSEVKLSLASIKREAVATQAKHYAVRRPDCPLRGGVCHVKDYRDHAIATLFGQVTVRLPRFRCAACGAIEVGIAWPSRCRSTPELDWLQTHLTVLHRGGWVD
jgi:hypothetical protein